MRDGPPTPAELIGDIAAARATTVADYMAAANSHYYATRDPLGVAGDFTTAPEISQMFGEMIGVWIADLWARAGRPAFRYIELGPGRGTLAADALRAMARFGCTPLAAHFVETSSTLRTAQSARIPAALHHDDIDAVSYTHLRAHETVLDLVCRLLLEKKKTETSNITFQLNTLYNKTSSHMNRTQKHSQ